ncbi:MAG: hypothetical protein Q8O88_03565 [bacterium]|nr:hypothetical protein [bacterium]
MNFKTSYIVSQISRLEIIFKNAGQDRSKWIALSNIGFYEELLLTRRVLVEKDFTRSYSGSRSSANP